MTIVISLSFHAFLGPSRDKNGELLAWHWSKLWKDFWLRIMFLFKSAVPPKQTLMLPDCDEQDLILYFKWISTSHRSVFIYPNLWIGIPLDVLPLTSAKEESTPHEVLKLDHS